jgi:hypothetical protein
MFMDGLHGDRILAAVLPCPGRAALALEPACDV